MLSEFERLALVLSERCEGATDAPELNGERRAAVAMILRRATLGPEILLMRRVENPADRWSGQISLPGGHFDEADRDLCTTAQRETREEVGVDLARVGTQLGSMPPVQAKARGKIVSTRITPFVFALEEDVQLIPGAEASEVFWFPLERAEAGALDDEYHYVRDDGLVRKLPSWRFEERVVWGLTYFMLRDLLALMRNVTEHGASSDS